MIHPYKYSQDPLPEIEAPLHGICNLVGDVCREVCEASAERHTVNSWKVGTGQVKVVLYERVSGDTRDGNTKEGCVCVGTAGVMLITGD
jgi:hypothetical protein